MPKTARAPVDDAHHCVRTWRISGFSGREQPGNKTAAHHVLIIEYRPQKAIGSVEKLSCKSDLGVKSYRDRRVILELPVHLSVSVPLAPIGGHLPVPSFFQ